MKDVKRAALLGSGMDSGNTEIAPGLAMLVKRVLTMALNRSIVRGLARKWLAPNA